jgi:hypothetical protein
MRMTIESFLLVGTPSLLCSVGTKALDQHTGYCPIGLAIVDAHGYGTPDWFAFATLHGRSLWDEKLQWLFDRPQISLIEYQDTLYEGEGPNAVEESFRFYAGIEFRDHAHQHRLRAMASQLSDFVFHVDIIDEGYSRTSSAPQA